jgi:hypothetical protein
MGQSFRPDFLYISRLIDLITQSTGRRPPVAAMTATARVRSAIVEKLQLHSRYVEIRSNPNRPELRFVVYNRRTPNVQIRSQKDKYRTLLRILRAADRNDESAIVYVNTTREAERLARRLETSGINARFYHGQMDDQARKDVQDMFLEGQIRTIVATKAFGMGVDKSDIRYVIHYQIPGDLESYFQEAGRDGAVSWAILLYHERDLWIHEKVFIPQSLPDPAQIESVFAWLRLQWQSNSDNERLFIEPRLMTSALGYDEETSLGAHLHILEEMGLARREADATSKASARLLSPLAVIDARARELDGGVAGRTVLQILRQYQINSLRRGEIDLLLGAQQVGVDPRSVDDLLYRLALEGHLIYRAFARAYVLASGPNDKPTTQILPDDFATGVREEMKLGLEAMRRYAENAQMGDCLRAELLHHFDAEKPPTPRHQCCSLCDVSLVVPWANEPMWEDLADPARYQDAKYAVLKAAAWNADLANQRGRSPYGAWTLAQILIGNDYAATQFEDDAERRRYRRKIIVATEHYGVLEGLQRGANAVFSLLDELKVEGLVAEQHREYNGGRYTYPAATASGLERLVSGQLFGRENDDEM